MRYLGMRTPPSNHHPWFFTCIVGAAYQLGVNLGDRNIGMFLYIVLRGIVMAALYARCVAQQKKNKVPFTICFLTMLFFAVTPVWGAYAKHAFKDSIGAALFCWFICASIPVVLALHQKNLKPLPCLEYAVAGLFASLFRNNTVYVVIPVTLLIVVLALRRKQKLHSVLLLLCGVLLFEAYQGYIFRVAGVERGSIREALSIPFQQTARTVRDHAEEITEEEKRIIGACLDYENLGTDYDPLISDPVKSGEHGTPSEQRAFLKTWVKMFFKYPYTYLEAFLAHSSGYYAFIPEFTEAQYFGNGSHVNIGMTVFNTVDDIRFPADFVCHYISGLAGIREMLAGWSYLWHEIPILNITDIKAMYTWVIVLMGYALIRRKEYEKLIPVGACSLMILTCIASPVNDCFRYYAPVAAAFPTLFILLKEDEKRKE